MLSFFLNDSFTVNYLTVINNKITVAYKKGQSGNPDGRPPKVKPGTIIESGFINSAETNNQPNPYDQKRQEINKNRPFQYFGSDNLFPDAVADLTRKSPSHRAILNNKVLYCVGKGFSTEDQFLAKYIKSVNIKNESLSKVGRKIANDFLREGNAYMEVVKVKKDSKEIFLYHIDSTDCRLSKDGKYILLYDDWDRLMKNSSLEKDLKKIPLYPNFEEIDGAMRCIYHFKDYEPKFKFYGVPSWVAAMDAAAIAYKTDKWNVSRLDNSFVSSGVLLLEGNVTPEEGKKIKEDFNKQFTGEQKQGKVFFVIKQLGGGATSFTPINSQNEGDWIQIKSQSNETLIMAHNWFTSLSGLATPGSLGTNQQVKTEYELAKSTTIADVQEFFLEEYKKIITEQTKLKTDDLAYIQRSPVSETRPALNGIQITSMIDVVIYFNAGVLTESVAREILIASFTFTEDEAAKIISEKEKGEVPTKELEELLKKSKTEDGTANNTR